MLIIHTILAVVLSLQPLNLSNIKLSPIISKIEFSGYRGSDGFFIYSMPGNKKLHFPRKDITGQKFGRLTVMKFDKYSPEKNGNRNTRQPMWIVKCDCGTIKYMSQYLLVNKDVKSCGCLRKEILKRERTTKLEKGEAAFNALYRSYINNSKKKEMKFTLSKEQFRKLTCQPCFYCGTPPLQVFIRKDRDEMSGGYIYNGIDRKDNSVGYTLGNSVPCCGMCNLAKRNLRFEDFVQWIKRLSEYAIKMNYKYDKTT